jgi:hypothetical protein
VLTRAILAGEPARLVGRLLIVSYYFNQAAAAVEAYVHLRTPEAAAALQRWGAGPPPGALRFPWAHVILLLPAASAAAARLPPAPLYAASLLFYTLASDAAMTWGHLKILLLHRCVLPRHSARREATAASSTPAVCLNSWYVSVGNKV